MSKHGGYRKGSGRSKSGHYKGIYCGSTYELCWVIHSIDHNVGFTRFPGKLEKDGVSYYPDFLLSDKKTIIETKGYEKQESVQKKIDVAESHGYKVQVLRKQDLSFAFDYVTKKYGTSRFHELYDGYKPKYDYQCCNCNSAFSSDKKKKTQVYFCSNICAGKYRHSKNIMSLSSTETKKKISQSLLGKKYQSYKRKHKQMWITNGVIDTRIKVDDAIPEGFVRGRSHRLTG